MKLTLKYILGILILLAQISAIGQLNIIVKKIPANTPPDDNIFIAGNFNGWNPGNQSFRLQKDSNSWYRITIQPQPGTVRFKFTRGSWDKVEGNANGGFIPDRTESYSGQSKTVELEIAGWEDMGSNSGGSTAGPGVSVLSSSFFMPQLNRNRRIWIYLPPDYNSSSKNYPVLYMHDGQNLFDRQTAFAGEWKVDESLDSLHMKGDHGCIVVGIDNGGAQRINEYSPWVNPQYGGGQGNAYIRFIAETLKPHIDSTYRTMPDAENTGIMGSSMGGLISTYGGISFPDVFGKIGAFSSSFWFSPQSYNYVSDTGVGENTFVYMVAGAQEGGNQVEDMQRMADLLKEKGLVDSKIISISHNDGAHSEWYWAREFPEAYKWLFEKKTSKTNENKTEKGFEIKLSYPYINILDDNYQGNYLVMVTDRLGNIVQRFRNNLKSYELNTLQNGMYFLTVTNEEGNSVNYKFVVLH